MADKLTDAAVRARFIEAYGRSGSYNRAAAASNVLLNHVIYFRRRNADFAAACRDACAAPVRARRTWQRVTPARRAAFLAELARSGSVGKACRASSVWTTSIYALRRVDAGFAADWADARDQALDRVEDRLFEAALDGFTETVEKAGVIVTRRTQRPAAMFKLLSLRRRVGRAGTRTIELTPALIASARAKFEAAMRLAATIGEVPPPPLAVFPPPTVTAA